jgi:hypothetical protein
MFRWPEIARTPYVWSLENSRSSPIQSPWRQGGLSFAASSPGHMGAPFFDLPFVLVLGNINASGEVSRHFSFHSSSSGTSVSGIATLALLALFFVVFSRSLPGYVVSVMNSYPHPSPSGKLSTPSQTLRWCEGRRRSYPQQRCVWANGVLGERPGMCVEDDLDHNLVDSAKG